MSLMDCKTGNDAHPQEALMHHYSRSREQQVRKCLHVCCVHLPGCVGNCPRNTWGQCGAATAKHVKCVRARYCKTRATFAVEGSKTAVVYAAHAVNGMRDVVKKLCSRDS